MIIVCKRRHRCAYIVPRCVDTYMMGVFTRTQCHNKGGIQARMQFSSAEIFCGAASSDRVITFSYFSEVSRDHAVGGVMSVSSVSMRETSVSPGSGDSAIGAEELRHHSDFNDDGEETFTCFGENDGPDYEQR